MDIKHILVFLISFGLLSCNSNIDDAILVSDLPTNDLDLQRHIIGQLSGHKPLDNGIVINARWSKAERQLTRDYLKQLISNLNIKPVTQAYVSPNINPAIDLIFEPFRGTNVYSILPATIKTNDYIILGAHYDTGRRGAPGAVDNATGITLIYTIVKQMKALAYRNKNIVLVFFDQEEEENVGSRAFVKLIKDKAWNVHSVHCFDMAGWDGDNNEEFEIFSASEELIGLYKRTSERHRKPLHVLHIDPLKTSSGSTDYYAFLEADFNAIGAGECVYKGDYSPYKDTTKDTYETVDFEYLWSNTQIVSEVIKNLISN